MTTSMRTAAVVLCLALLALGAAAATAPGTLPAKPPKNMSEASLNINAWQIACTNYGPFVNPGGGNSGGYWNGPGYNYIYGGGLWFAATTPSNVRAVSCGYNPNSGQYEFCPSTADGNTSGYLSDASLRVYVSTNPADVLNWPRVENGKKIIKSRQDSYCTYSDIESPFGFSGSNANNIVVEQISYAWNYADNNDIVFFIFHVKNKNSFTLTNCRIAPCLDCDIGSESGTNANDLTTFDYTRNLAMQYQTTNESGWPRTGVVGFRFFEGPMNNTGATVNVVDVGTPNYSHSIAPGDPLGMTVFRIFTIDIDPQDDENRYLTLEGINYTNMIRDDYDETGDDAPGDKRFVMASGPFLMGPDSMVTLCVGAMAAWDTTALKLASDVAQTIYDNDFELSNPPIAPTITATAGDKWVRISWNTVAEDSIDTYKNKIDTANGGLGIKRWHNYFPGSWIYCTDKALVDSFIVRTGAATTDTIARGAAQGAWTDTMSAFYNQVDMYSGYDFQGYIVVKARTMSDLMEPAKRSYLGTYYTSPETGYNAATCSYLGGAGWMYDKKDGVQIVPNFTSRQYSMPGGSITLPVWDTLGVDRGLIYTLVDDDVVNGQGYYYGVIAYDYQPNVFFTHKCPTSLATNPTENAVYVVPRTPVADYKTPSYRYVHQGGADKVSGGSADLDYELEVATPTTVKDDSFKIRWAHQRTFQGTMRVPNYKGYVYDGSGTLTDSIDLVMKYGTYGNYTDVFYGTWDDQLLQGGLVYRPWVDWRWGDARIDSLVIIEAAGGSRTYPRDSVSFELLAAVVGGPNYYCNWQWRGSDYEIRWKDTLTNSLTAQVWDLTNNVEVPLEAGVTKANMVKSSWCFNPLTTAGGATVDSGTSSNTYGIHIAGVTVYFNKAGATLRRMSTLWGNRPETGDVWRVYCSGPRPPTEGNITTVYTQAAGQVAALSEDLLKRVKVVPNPFLVRADWDVSKNYPNVYFTNLPAKCTIRIYTLGGDLVKVIKHESSFADNDGTERWDLLTTYNRRIASGVYIYQVDAPGIGTKIDKFAIIK